MSNDDSAKWRAIYNQSEQVRRLADKIHNSRMISGPACDQCIEIAAGILRDAEFMAVLPQTKSK